MPIDAGLKTVIFFVVLVLGGLASLAAYQVSPLIGILVGLGAFMAAWALSSAVRLVTQWQKAVVLSLGKYAGLRGPGLFFITPFVQSVSMVIDTRTITSTFNADQTITADTVPVDVDAVLFWRVTDPEKAALQVAQYDRAVGWAAQTALRDVIGRSTLADILSARDKIDTVLRQIIDSKTEPWGVQVESVEIRDVKIPPALQDAMSRQAQAERERQARIILGESETQIAQKFAEAARFYENNPTAMHLRAMNMLYEGMKDKGSLIIVPSSALDSMNLGAMNMASYKNMADNHNAVLAASGPSAGPAAAQQPAPAQPPAPAHNIAPIAGPPTSGPPSLGAAGSLPGTGSGTGTGTSTGTSTSPPGAVAITDDVFGIFTTPGAPPIYKPPGNP